MVGYLEGERKGVAHAVRWRATEYSLYWLHLLKNRDVSALYREGGPELIGRPLWGDADLQGYTDPLVQWRPDNASPSGLAYAAGSLWAASLNGERLWQSLMTMAEIGATAAGLTGLPP